MTKLQFIGDAHGKWRELKESLDPSVDYSIQVGDMGFGFPNKVYPEFPSNFYWIAGNHDNFEELELNPPSHYIPKSQTRLLGSVTLGFLGGGESIDKNWRIHGSSWWPQETITFKEMEEAIIKFNLHKPKIICTHECPLSIRNMVTGSNKIDIKGFDTSSKALEIVWKNLSYKPEYWIFGHHHVSFDKTFNGLRFIGLNELQSLILEV